MSNVPKEIVTLAEHQLEILDRRFPNNKHTLYKHGWACWISVRDNAPTIIWVSFCSNFIEIVWSYVDKEAISIILNYADPNFTDDAISDIIKEWEEVGHESRRRP